MLFAAHGVRAQSTPSRSVTRVVVDTLVALIRRTYPDSQIAAAMVTAISNDASRANYALAHSDSELAVRLTADLYASSHDKHISVRYEPIDTAPAAMPATEAMRRAEAGRRSNFGVQRAEILPHNIGYLNLTRFYRRTEGEDALAAAMHFLRNADALILDLRSNGGGSPDMVCRLLSYLSDSGHLELFSQVSRDGSTTTYFTDDTLPLEHDGTRPLYVLTSHSTFSAGEGAAYLLQERGRAAVIGEQTAGAANPGRPYRLNNAYVVNMPNSRILSAVKRSNWEGIGVLPDLPIDAADALKRAIRQAQLTLGRSRPNRNLRH